MKNSLTLMAFSLFLGFGTLQGEEPNDKTLFVESLLGIDFDFNQWLDYDVELTSAEEQALSAAFSDSLVSTSSRKK